MLYYIVFLYCYIYIYNFAISHHNYTVTLITAPFASQAPLETLHAKRGFPGPRKGLLGFWVSMGSF